MVSGEGGNETAVSSSAEGAKIWSYLIDLLCVGGVFTCGYACSAFRLAPCQRSLPGPRPGLTFCVAGVLYDSFMSLS